MVTENNNLFPHSTLEVDQEFLLESVVENSPFVLWSMDDQGIIQSIRGGGLKELKLNAEQMIGNSVLEMYADDPQLIKVLQDSLAGKEFHAVVHLYNSRLETWFRPIKEKTNRTVGAMGITLVRSELEKGRTAGSQEGHCFEILKRLANVGVFSCNEQGEVQFANDYFWSCFSLIESTDSSNNAEANPRQGVIWQNLFRDENNQPLKKSSQLLASQGNYRRELKLAYPRKSIDWVLVQLNEASPGEWVGTVLDISSIKQAESMFGLQRRELEKGVQSRTLELVERNTQLSLEVEKRKQIAQELQLSRDYMEAIIRNTVDIILHLDRDGRILFMNRSVTGYDISKIVGGSLYEWIQPGHEHVMKNALERVLEKEEHVYLEMPIILVTGDYALYSTQMGPIYHQGEIIGATIVARDITREREREEQAKERLDELSHLTRLGMLGEIMATISHELKQPLLAIGNYATGSLHRIDDQNISQEQLKEVLQLIAELSLRARKIVHKTRNFATKKEIEPTPVNPQELLSKSLELVQTELKRKDIILKNELDESIAVMCVDFIQGQQVIVNLLLNAIEAISQSKKNIQHTITVRSALIESDFVQLTISDTADGIDHVSLESLFDMYHSSNKSGLGMGLAISKKIIERHSGKLRVLQTNPEGTTFEMLLPICETENC